MKIPTRCEFCNIEIDTREADAYRWTAGWVEKREGGFAPDVLLAERFDRWAHGGCVERAERDVAEAAMRAR
jgi:hypothetical protein